uniref:Uncharacterized protein n=1 Tax=Heterorhabditis bacteriophora TaxID=37862 RepID=A0A1I7X1B6_HETBA
MIIFYTPNKCDSINTIALLFDNFNKRSYEMDKTQKYSRKILSKYLDTFIFANVTPILYNLAFLLMDLLVYIFCFRYCLIMKSKNNCKTVFSVKNNLILLVVITILLYLNLNRRDIADNSNWKEIAIQLRNENDRFNYLIF